MTLQAETNMLFTTNSAERMRIDSSGNVGIGTSSPSAPLTVDNTTNNQIRLRRTSSGNNVLAMAFSDTGSTGETYVAIGSDGDDLVMRSGNAETMRIDSSGNVGIGTSSPDTALHVAGNSTVRNTIVSNFTLDGGVQVPNPYDGFGFGIDFIGRDYGDAVRDYAYIYSVMEASGSSAGGGDASFKAGLSFYTNGGGASGTTPTERMRIDHSGRVGIGTDSPGVKFVVANGADAAVSTQIFGADETSEYLGFGQNGAQSVITAGSAGAQSVALVFQTAASGAETERMRIDSSGNVGIGTSSPEAELHIAKSTSGGRGGTLVIENSHSSILNNEVQIAFLTDAGASLAGISNARIKAINTDAGTGAAALTFTTWSGSAEGEAMRIDSSGNVGIGTSSPSYQLDIQGGTTTNDRVRLLRGTDDINQFMTMGWNSISTHRADVALASAQTGLSFNQVGSDGTRTAMQIDSSGNVGIGTSSPNARLEVEDGGTAESVILKVTADDSAPYAFVVGNDTYSTTDTHGLAMWVGDDGQAKIDARGSGAYLVTRIQGTERMRLDASGNLLVGTTSADPTGSGSSGRVVINTANGGQAALTCYNVGTGAVNIISLENGNGQVGRIQINGTTTSYLTSSDYRLKEDWQLMSGASDRVLALKPVNFAWKVDGSRVDGFLAHEVAEVVPEAIAGTKDAVDADGNPEYQGIDQSKLIPLLTAALQEALTKIDALETRITTLEG
jgi:hypothetical protein